MRQTDPLLLDSHSLQKSKHDKIVFFILGSFVGVALLTIFSYLTFMNPSPVTVETSDISMLYDIASSSDEGFNLPPLPWEMGDLEPMMSRETVHFHYLKHHGTYVNKLNSLLKGTSFLGLPLETVMLESYRHKDQNSTHRAIFNNAGQHWNHCFFWNSLTPPDEQGSTGGRKHALHKSMLAKKIKEDYQDLDTLISRFRDVGVAHFGSGWTWLVYNSTNDKLAIMSTHDAENPIVLDSKLFPLLTMDVWEHAYYLDYRNQRNTYADVFVRHLANWEFAGANYYNALDRLGKIKPGTH